MRQSYDLSSCSYKNKSIKEKELKCGTKKQPEIKAHQILWHLTSLPLHMHSTGRWEHLQNKRDADTKIDLTPVTQVLQSNTISCFQYSHLPREGKNASVIWLVNERRQKESCMSKLLYGVGLFFSQLKRDRTRKWTWTFCAMGGLYFTSGKLSWPR